VNDSSAKELPQKESLTKSNRKLVSPSKQDMDVVATLPDKSWLFEESIDSLPDYLGESPIMLFFEKHGMSAAECLKERLWQTKCSHLPKPLDWLVIIKSGIEMCASQEILIDDEDKIIRACKDPMTCLVYANQGVSLAIVLPESFTVNGKMVAQVKMETLGEMTAIKCRVIIPS
jgi:hypothetical protein